MFDVYFNIGSSIQPIYAASSARINPDDMLTVLNDITVAGQSWENIGFVRRILPI